MTRAVPASCRSIARVISTSQQYFVARKSALTSSRMIPASSRCSLMAPSHSVPASMRRSCQPLITPWDCNRLKWVSSLSRRALSFFE